MTQKGVLYTKVFNALSEVILMCCILAYLNILCSSVIKPYFSIMAIYPLFTVHMLRPLHAFSNILDLIKAEQSIYQNVQFFIWSKKSVFSILLQLDILCTSVVKNTVIKMTIHRTRVTGFLCTVVHGSQKNLLPSSLELNLVNFILWRALQQKLYRQDF